MTSELFLTSISYDGEKWELLPYPNNNYAISSMGRVVSFSRKKPNLLSIVIQENKGKQYAYVCINCKKVRVHRLVASAFLPNPNGYNEIDHINNIPYDNRVSNLKWCTHKDNANNPLSKEVQRQYRLEHPCNVDPSVFFNRHEDKMKAIAQIKDGKIIARYKSLGEAERKGYKKTSLSAVLHGRLKTYKGYEWALLSEQE